MRSDRSRKRLDTLLRVVRAAAPIATMANRLDWKASIQMTLRSIVLLISLLARSASGQEYALSDRDLHGRIVIGSSYEQLDLATGKMSQWSIPLTISIPIAQRTTLGAHVSRARASSDSTGELSGLSDVQFEIAKYVSLGSGSMIARLTGNLPSGKQHLTEDEFRTASTLSYNVYDFATASLSQGAGIAPSISLAMPITAKASIGIAAGYYYRGGYDPLESLSSTYYPGRELLVAGGFDLRLSNASIFSADGRFSLYGRDRVDETEIFQAGNKIVGRVQYQRWFGSSNLLIRGVYRSRANDNIASAEGVLFGENERIWPNEKAATVRFGTPVGSFANVTMLASVYQYGATVFLNSQTVVYRVGAVIEARVSRNLEVPVRLLVHQGDVSGYDVGIGITSTF